MDIIIGSARINEYNKIIGGKAGDQKQTFTPDYKGEVSMQRFYVHSKGWYILRPKNANIALKIAANMINACNNRNIGYNQNQRYDIIKYGTKSKVPTSCDCSSLVRVCIQEASGKEIPNFTTVNEANVLEQSGLFEKRIPYTSSTKLYTGDVLVTKTRGHTGCVTAGNARTDSVRYFAQLSNTNTTSITEALRILGEKDTSFEYRKKIAAVNNIQNYSGTAYQNTYMLNLLKQGKLIKP